MQGLALGITALISMQTAPPPSASAAVEVQVTHAASAAPAAPEASAAARKTYAERCAVCHGDSGAGDGPAAKGLMTRPRRFADAIWQESVTDAHIQKAILEGGFAVKKSSAMPAHPDLREQVADLVRVVRSFRSRTGTVAVDVIAPDGKLVDTHTADPDKAGACRVNVPLKKAGPHRLVVRVAGRATPACTLDVPGAGGAAPACDAARPAPAPGPASAELSPDANTAR